MPDLAQLNLVINSQQVTAADKAEQSLISTSQKLETQTKKTNQAFADGSGAATGHNSAISRLMGSYEGLLKIAGYVTAAVAAVSFAIDAVKEAAQQELRETAFATLLGDAEKAKKMLADLRDFANTTPFRFAGLADASRLLLAFGFNAEKIPGTIRTIADAAAAMGGSTDTIQRIARALGEIQAQGKLSSLQLRMLASDGIPAAQILADALGTTVPKALEMIEKKALSGDEAIEILLKGMQTRYKDATLNLSQTTAGLWSTMLDVIQGIMVKIGAALIQFFNIKGLEKDLISFLGKWGDFSAQVIQALAGVSDAENKVSASAKEAARWIETIAGAAAAALFIDLASSIDVAAVAMKALDLVMAFNPFGLAAAAIGLAIGALIYFKDTVVSVGGQTVTVGDIVVGVWHEASKLVVEFFREIYLNAKYYWDLIPGLVEKTYDYLLGTQTEYKNKSSMTWSDIGNDIVDVFKSVLNFFGFIIKAMEDILGDFLGRLQNFVTSFGNLDFSSGLSGFKASISKVVEQMEGSFGSTGLVDVLKKDWTDRDANGVGGLVDAFKMAGKQAKDQFVAGFKAGDAASDLKSLLSGDFSSVWSSVIANAMKNAQTRSLASFMQDATSVWSRISSFAKTSASSFFGSGAEAPGEQTSPQQEKALDALSKMNEKYKEDIELLKQGNDEQRLASDLIKIRTLTELAYKPAVTASAAEVARLAEEQKKAVAETTGNLFDVQAGKAGQSLDEMISKTQEEINLIGDTNDAKKNSLEIQKLINSYAFLPVQYQTQLNAQVNQLIGLQGRLAADKSIETAARGIGDAFGNAFETAIMGAKSLQDVLHSLANDIEKTILHQAISVPISNLVAGGLSSAGTSLIGSFFGAKVQPSVMNVTSGASSTPLGQGAGGLDDLASANAKGNAFYHGIEKFASGGVFNVPTMFRMANGRRGVMGEAGPEAVMPLVRSSDGSLGVRQSGGGVPQTHNHYWTVNTPNADSFRRSQRQVQESISNTLKKASA